MNSMNQNLIPEQIHPEPAVEAVAWILL